MTKLILFGLSADMPHNGHIEWLDVLKRSFSDHRIVVMPCNANPLGKNDAKGNIIYPSNGFLRWQMLYEFYQEHDPDIIVSQYEVAINTPSKTIDTLDYLLHTPIDEIINQRGFTLPNINNQEIINQVAITLGTDLVNELSNWHKWQDILKSAKLIVMQRAGYKNIQETTITNPQLQQIIIEKIKDQTLIELPGPQVHISSRELKKLLQNGAADDYLKKFIPAKILDFIRKQQSEFSDAYYENPQARATFQEAMAIYKSTVSNFDKIRKSELNTYIYDFKSLGKIDKQNSSGYFLDNGRLKINLSKVDSEEFSKQIDNWMHNLDCEWYIPHQKTGKIHSPHQFNAGFKLLGKYGPNLAIDVMIFVEDENSKKLEILCINRNDDTKSLAVPGGFYQGDTINTACHEFLEECCSNNLFAANSPTVELINQKYHNKQKQFIKDINLVLKKNGISNYSKQNQKVSPSLIIKDAITYLTSYVEKTNKSCQLLAQIKCDLYVTLLNDKYNILLNFFAKQGKIAPPELCVTDERNTNLAWMVTKVVRYILPKATWENLLKTCGLEICGGDDAAEAKLLSIEDFCKNQNTFALHKYLVLRNLAKFQEEN